MNPVHLPAPAGLRGIGCLLALAWLGPLAAAAVPSGYLVPDEAGLAKGAGVSLPEAPAWIPAPGTPLCSIEVIEADLGRSCDAHPQMIHQARAFVRPDQRWLVAYVKWFAKLERPLHLQFTDEAFDCDKYSRCFVAFADLLALKAGEKRASVSVGWVSVLNDEAYGGVEAGGGHALVIAETSDGLFIIEPQTGVMTPLAKYPNRNRLQRVNL
jgi:hypothetical protein